MNNKEFLLKPSDLDFNEISPDKIFGGNSVKELQKSFMIF